LSSLTTSSSRDLSSSTSLGGRQENAEHFYIS
jgi:hypothetical protein